MNHTITREFFQHEMEKLFAVFGREEYPAARILIIFDLVKDLHPTALTAMVLNYCHTRKVKDPPLPEQFLRDSHRHRAFIEVRPNLSIPAEPITKDLTQILDGYGIASLGDYMRVYQQGNRNPKE